MSHTLLQSGAKTLWIFESNYRLLLKLLPELAQCDCFEFIDEDGLVDIKIEVRERFKYTTELKLSKLFNQRGRWVTDLTMDVRLYLDARVAEVMSYQDCHNIPAPYDSTEKGRYSRDEKRQVNQLLHELLQSAVFTYRRTQSEAV